MTEDRGQTTEDRGQKKLAAANPVLDSDTILEACERILRALITPLR